MTMTTEKMTLNYADAKGLYLSLVREAENSKLPLKLQLDIVNNIKTLKSVLHPIDKAIEAKLVNINSLNAETRELSELKTPESEEKIKSIRVTAKGQAKEVNDFLAEQSFNLELIKIDVSLIVDETVINPGFLLGVSILI